MHTLRQIVGMMMRPPAGGGGLPAGLVGWWKAEGNLDDEAGANPLSNVGSGLSYVAGVDGQAFQYAGSGAAQMPAINVGSTWSLEVWVKPNAAVGAAGASILGGAGNVANTFGRAQVVNFPAAPSMGGFDYHQNGANRFGISSDNTLRLMRVGNFYKLTFRYVAGTIYGYINDVFCGSYTATQDWNQIVRFCGDALATLSNYACAIDDIKLWNIDIGAPAAASNLAAEYLCSDNADSAPNDWQWNAWANGSESYATGADGTPGGAWNHANSANDVRSLHALNLGSAWTVIFDIYPITGTGNNGGVLNRTGSTDGWIADAGGTGLLYRFGGNNYIISAGSITPLNTWSTIKTTYDGSRIRMYRNGVLNATEAGTHSEPFNSNNHGVLQTGTNPFGSGRFRGRLDNIRFYNAVV